jgi:hypothetical protein
MDEIVLMLKDAEGLFVREVGALRLEGNGEYLTRAYVREGEGGLRLCLTLSTGADVSDAAFEDILDRYDTEIYKNLADSVAEVDAYNPSWELTLPFSPGQEALEAQVAALLAAHKQELEAVLATGVPL